MKRCEVSGKGMTFGHQVSHSHRATNRVWKPNLQPVVITVNGKSLKVKVCTKVLKTLKSATEVETMQILKANKNNLSPRIQKFLSK
ncbi:MAG: 50S ribosomal protein L28 [Fusobacterium sp. JB021]|nr:50S ribosomal protein L28 [Fusobacterium sp. JB020]MDP0493403.1 50S ribosomal protein L28 [Fusobacterium sp. JB021]MDP0507637.1 50S ribosomal protein L28 [Fusobacterium sp. JB019]